MDRNNGLEAKISREETRTTIKMDLGETPPLPIRVSLQNPQLHIEATTRIMEDGITNAQSSYPIEAISK